MKKISNANKIVKDMSKVYEYDTTELTRNAIERDKGKDIDSIMISV